MKRKRKAQKEANEYAKRLHHELGSWRDTTKERCYTYCARCGEVLTIHVEQETKYNPTMKWNSGGDVTEYECSVGKTMSDKVKKAREDMPYEPT